MSVGRQKSVLAIALDAAEVTLIRRWMDAGVLPNLSAIREQGSFARLKSTAEWFVGSPWPSFYTGTPPSVHGMYHYLVWRPEVMKSERPSPEWMPLRPFWRSLEEFGRRALVIDAPLVYAPGSFNGVEIAGWATHEILDSPASHPPELMGWATETFGSPPLGVEQINLWSAADLLEVREECIRTTELDGDLAVQLMQQEPWDLFLIGFAATHRGGHHLWDLSNMFGEASPSETTTLNGALKDIYVACDAAIGRLIEKAPSDVTTLVFSLHGMGPNIARADLMRDMLERVLSPKGSETSSPQTPRSVQRLRGLVPLQWRNWVKSRLPMAIQDRLTLFWRTGGLDWPSTKAFVPFGDLEGYVRINLRGREAAGIVEPGAEYEDLCAEIADGLLTFVDEDTGEPIVAEVKRVDEALPDESTRHLLPDLVIRWSPRPAAEHRLITSQRHGSIPWPTPGYPAQGRSGNHWPDGFLLARGERIPPSSEITDAHILDLAPTIHDLLDIPVPAGMTGRSLL